MTNLSILKFNIRKSIAISHINKVGKKNRIIKHREVVKFNINLYRKLLAIQESDTEFPKTPDLKSYVTMKH